MKWIDSLLDGFVDFMEWHDALPGRIFLAICMVLVYVLLGLLVVHFALALAHLSVNPAPPARLSN